jgi:hypothetical protein
LSQPLLQRLILVGRYLIVIKNDTRLFALAGGRSGTASSTACRGATTATCRTTAYRDASTAYSWAATAAVTTSGTARTAKPRDDYAAGLVAPLDWSDVDVIQCVGIITNNAVLVAWFAQRGS